MSRKFNIRKNNWAETKQNWNAQSKEALQKSFSDGNGFNSAMNILGGITSIAGYGMKNAETNDMTAYQNEVANFGNANFNTDNHFNLVGDYLSNVQPDEVTKSDLMLSNGEYAKNTLSSTASGAMTGFQVGGPWGALVGGVIGLGAGIGGIITGNKNAEIEEKRLNGQLEAAKTENFNRFNYSAGVVNDKMFNAAALNYRAYGGDLYDNAMIMKHFNNDKIKHRKISYVGNLFAYGGQMRLGGDWSNGVTIIGEGGTHEMNPYDGVQVGVDENGTPNLVEEGEVIFNDYVYSNRLKPTAKQLEEVNLCEELEGETFAEIAKKISKESEERPNDPISKNGLIDGMMKLQAIQEEVRQKKAEAKFKREFNKLSPEEQGAIAMQMMQPEQTELEGGEEEPFNFDSRYAPNGNPQDELNAEYGFANGGNLFAGGSWLPILSNEFQYYDNKTRKYDQKYLDWLDTYDIENSKYWDALSKLYKDTFKRDLTIDQARKLGRDEKFGHFHKALGEAFSDFENERVTDNDNSLTKLSQTLKVPERIKTESLLKTTGAPYGEIKVPSLDQLPKENGNNNRGEWLRYMPAIGSGIQTIADLFGYNKPDYTKANMIGQAARRIRNARAPQLYDYLRFTPYDVNYQQNRIQNIGLGTQRNVLNTTFGNRAAALAALLATNNSTLGNMGDMYRNALEYNDQQRKLVADFNRGTNQTNLQSILSAEQANQNADVQRANLILQQAKMMDDIDTASSAAISANRSNFFKNLGKVGEDNYYSNQADWLLNSGWVPQNETTKRYPRGRWGKNGGKLRKNKRMI